MRLHKEVRASCLVGRGLKHGCSLLELKENLRPIHSVSLNSLTTMEELYKRVDRYSTLKYNIHVATQTVMITGKSAESNKLEGKKLPVSKEGQRRNQKRSCDYS